MKRMQKRKLSSGHVLSGCFLCFILLVGIAGFSDFMSNTLDFLGNPRNPLGYIQKTNQQYEGMLETDADMPLLQNKGTYINLNGLMARALGQPMMNNRVKLKNGHMASLKSKMPEAEKIQAAAENIIQFCHTHRASGGGFLFVMAPSQISKYEELLPTGYIDTANDTADAFLALLEQSQVPFLDLREALEAEGISVSEAFYTTDHHWTPQTGLWAYGKILDTLAENGSVEAVDSFYTDPENFLFETYEDTFLGSSGRRTGKYFGGLDDSAILRPAFETEISVEVPQLPMTARGRYEDVSYNIDIAPDYAHPDYFNKNFYGSYGWGDTEITHWRNENAPIQEKFLLIGESFGNVPFSLMSLCISSCDEVDMRHFKEDFTAYYKSYAPDTVVILVNVENTISVFTESYLK